MMQNSFLGIFLLCSVFMLITGGNTGELNVVVRVSNMTESMKQDAIRISKQAFTKFNGYSNKSRFPIAQYIRQQFDQLHSPSWQCMIGKDYAISVVSENEKRIILDINKIAVLIFKGKC